MSHYDDPYARIELAQMRSTAEARDCPYCGAQVGEQCHNKQTGELLVKLPAHRDRMREGG